MGTYHRIMDALPDDEKQEGSQYHVVIEPEVPKNGSLDTINSIFESSSELEMYPYTIKANEASRTL